MSELPGFKSDREPTKAEVELLNSARRNGRRRRAQKAALELAIAPRKVALAELRRESANAVQQHWPPDSYHLEEILWPSLQNYAKTVFDKIAEARLRQLDSHFSVRRYVHWLRCTCITAVVDDVCNGMRFSNTAKHILDVIGDGTGLAHVVQTRRALGKMVTEVLGGPHSEDIEKRLRAVLDAQVHHWEGLAIEKKSALPPSPPSQAEPVVKPESEEDTKNGLGDTGPRTPETAPMQPPLSGMVNTGKEDETADANTGTTSNAPTPTKIPEWEEIEISFIGDHDAEIRIAAALARRINYKEIVGFEDRRSGKPTQLWVTLRLFATLPNATLPNARESKVWVATQKKIERISKALRKHFGMTGDPLPYISEIGYRARIKIRFASDSSR